jgi:hypothetical protein
MDWTTIKPILYQAAVVAGAAALGVGGTIGTQSLTAAPSVSTAMQPMPNKLALSATFPVGLVAPVVAACPPAGRLARPVAKGRGGGFGNASSASVGGAGGAGTEWLSSLGIIAGSGGGGGSAGFSGGVTSDVAAVGGLYGGGGGATAGNGTGGAGAQGIIVITYRAA